MGRSWWIVGGVVAVAIGALLFAAGGDGGYEEVAESGPLVPGEETTRITGPLTEDGLPDYVAVLNADPRPAATANAAIPLLRVFGTGSLVGDVQATLQQLGAPDDLPGPSPFVAASLDARDDLDYMDAALDPTWEYEGQAQWSPSQQVRAWLTENSATLDTFVEATRRPRLWWPVVANPASGLLDTALPAATMQPVVEALVARSLLAAMDGDTGRSWSDAAAVLRLAALTDALRGSVWRAVSRDYHQQAIDLARYALEQGAPNGSQVRAMLGAIRAEPPPRPILADVDEFDRYMFLHSFLSQAGVAASGAAAHPALRAINAGFDQVAALLREPDADTYAALQRYADERTERTKALSEAVGTTSGQLQQAADAIATGGASAVRLVGEVLATMGVVVVPMVFRQVYRQETRSHAAQVAVALRLYFLEHGRYPEALDALVPSVLPALPSGSLDGARVPYRITDEGCVVGDEDEELGWALTLGR